MNLSQSLSRVGLSYLRIMVSIRVVSGADDLPPLVLVQCLFYDSVEIGRQVFYLISSSYWWTAARSYAISVPYDNQLFNRFGWQTSLIRVGSESTHKCVLQSVEFSASVAPAPHLKRVNSLPFPPKMSTSLLHVWGRDVDIPVGRFGMPRLITIWS